MSVKYQYNPSKSARTMLSTELAAHRTDMFVAGYCGTAVLASHRLVGHIVQLPFINLGTLEISPVHNTQARTHLIVRRNQFKSQKDRPRNPAQPDSHPFIPHPIQNPARSPMPFTHGNQSPVHPLTTVEHRSKGTQVVYSPNTHTTSSTQ